MIESIIICKHGNLGYSASLRFKNKDFNAEISSNSHEGIYKTIDYLVRKAKKMSKFVTKDSGKRQEFESGMVRDTQDGKLDVKNRGE